MNDMRSFYDYASHVAHYTPFRVEGFPVEVQVAGRAAFIPGQAAFNRGYESPKRKQNIVEQWISQCLVDRKECDSARVYFDFGAARRIEAATEIG